MPRTFPGRHNRDTNTPKDTVMQDTEHAKLHAELYATWVAADEKFQVALTGAFGNRAGDMRYESSAWGDHAERLKPLAEAYTQAMAAWWNRPRKTAI
jgi:hypothetical protein